jgi:hypothetical protein
LINRQRAVERFVQIKRDKLFNPIIEGITMDGKQDTMEQLANALSLTQRIALHNSEERKLGLHDQSDQNLVMLYNL